MFGHEVDLRHGGQLQKGGNGAAMQGLDREIADQFLLERHDGCHLVAHDFTSHADFLREGRTAEEGLNLFAAGGEKFVGHQNSLSDSTERGLLMAKAPAAVAITLSRLS
jgi:hypothetical protein